MTSMFESIQKKRHNRPVMSLNIFFTNTKLETKYTKNI